MEEMTKIFNFDKFKKIDLKVEQWVRLKSGIYENDLAQIVYIEDPLTKIYIRLVPRLSESSNNNINNKNKNNNTINNPQNNGILSKNARVTQKLFNPNNYSVVV
jgi:transcription elongation factor SPT5